MQIQNVTTVQELQELLVDDKFAFVVECGFLKPATSVVMGDIADIVHAVFLEYACDLAIHSGDCTIPRWIGSTGYRHTHPAASTAIEETVSARSH